MENTIYNLDWAKKNINKGFVFFWGHKQKGNEITQTCLSQWYRCNFKADGIIYNCAEQYMMAEKAKLFKDEETRQKILIETEQKTIKSLGREVKNFNHDLWGNNNTKIVVQGNLYKFGQNEDLKKYLLETGDKILVEASPLDKIWGIGLGVESLDVNDPNKWKGTNLLGFSLMKVRDVLKNEE